MISELSIPVKTTHDKKDKLSCLIETKLFFVSVYIKLEFFIMFSSTISLSVFPKYCCSHCIKINASAKSLKLLPTTCF